MDESARTSARQRQVLRLLALGRIDKEVAAELGLALGTVRVYRKRLAASLRVRGLGPMLLVAHRLEKIDIEALADVAMAERGNGQAGSAGTALSDVAAPETDSEQ